MIMMHRKRILLSIVIGYMLIGYTIDACVTTFLNDTGARIMIYNKEDHTLIAIGRNEKRRLGNQYKHARFAIYVQERNKPIFSRKYMCEQIRCARDGNAQLRFSELEKGSVSRHLFHIIRYKPYTPMVNDLPIMNSSPSVME